MANNLRLIIISLLLPLAANNAFAKHSENHQHKIININTNQENIKPNQNEVILVVHGVVCSFCSYGIQKKLSKLDFVDTSKFNKKGSVPIWLIFIICIYVYINLIVSLIQKL